MYLVFSRYCRVILFSPGEEVQWFLLAKISGGAAAVLRLFTLACVMFRPMGAAPRKSGLARALLRFGSAFRVGQDRRT